MALSQWLTEGITICILVVITHRNSLAKECAQDMISYEYTECKDNGRWKVAVPSSPECEITTPESPVYQKNCYISCERGEFFDMKAQVCSQCPAGSYSLGNGIRFDRWDEIPEEFSVTTSMPASFPDFNYIPKTTNCSLSGWTPRGDYISSGTDDCSSSLTYMVDVTSAGSLTFKYQSTDEDLLLHFFVRNSECRIPAVSPLNTFLSTTGANWKKYTVSLDKGINLLTWKSTGLLLGSKTQLRSGIIKEIEITGVAFTTKCHPCNPGYFSNSQGSDWCEPCASGTFSKAGAIECSPCDDKVSYSYPASPKCLAKPPCFRDDYFVTLTSCSDGLTNVTYSWNKPKICRDDVEDSIKLPESGLPQSCPPCNAGFYMGSSGCIPCSKGTFSKDGNSTCQKCAAGSHPVHGFLYHWWDKLPSNMAVSCLTIHTETCLGKQGWTANGGMMASNLNEIPVAFLILKLKIKGFRSVTKIAGGEVEYGRLKFVFELKCFDDCVMFLMKNEAGGSNKVLRSWHRKTEQSSFEYVFRQNETMDITWAYQKTSKRLHEDDKYSDDKAAIYSLELLNAVSSPAVDCIGCAFGSDKSGCIPCTAGHRIDESSKKCVKCPENTIMSHDTIQSENCSECSNGTVSNDAQTACQNDCTYYSSINNRSYEFTELMKGQRSASPPSFSGGHKYVHYYNFDVCGNRGFGNATCVSNDTMTDTPHIEEVTGMICRSTKFTSLGDDAKDLHRSSELDVIASVLKGVYDEDMNMTSECEFKLFPGNKELVYHDIVYEFAHPTPSDDCPHGTTAFVRLRCNPEIAIKDSSIKMPKHYPEGSCDGCNFHFLWESEGACPLCEESDYYSVESGCEDGYITTTYLWHSYPKMCSSGSLPADSQLGCTDVKLYVEVAVLGGVALLLFMMVTTLIFWKRNRTLEYKYQRLVGSSDPDAALKGADTCAVSTSESDNSDDEAVVFRKKRAKMLKKDETAPLNRSHNFVNM